MIEAAYKCHLEVVRLLIENEKIDVNAADSHERTALGEAASEGHIDVVKLLMRCGKIDLNAADRARLQAKTESVRLVIAEKIQRRATLGLTGWSVSGRHPVPGGLVKKIVKFL